MKTGKWSDIEINYRNDRLDEEKVVTKPMP